MESLIFSSNIYILLGIGLLIFSAFFSSTETAFFALNRYQLNRLRKQSRSGRMVAQIVKHPSRLLVGIIFGNILANTFLSAFSTKITLYYFGEVYVGLTVLLTSIIILIFGEVIPKTLALRMPETLSLLVSRIMYVYLKIISPFLFLIPLLTESIVNRFRSSSTSEHALTDQELISMVKEEGEQILEKKESEIVRRILLFSRVDASHIMTPHDKINALSLNNNRDTATQHILKTRRSRYPVFDDEESHIVGFINSKEFLLESKQSVAASLKAVFYISTNKRVEELFYQMQASQSPMAMVVNTYGELKGMITMTDILAELVGEIPDEFV